jgi:hypothetical protein
LLSTLRARAGALFGRIRVRLLAVNPMVVLIRAAGLEFARIYERQLLHGLERDMQNQAILLRTLLESRLERGESLTAADWEGLLARGATDAHAAAHRHSLEWSHGRLSSPWPARRPGAATSVARSWRARRE